MQIKYFRIWNTCLGNLFEHYDTALFGFLSPFLSSLIFPDQDPLTALILTYMIIPLSMLARPLGSLVFGYIGDVYGLRYALFLTLLGMGCVSGCIAFTPLSAAPLIFCLGKAAQNFFAAGETMGGAIYLLENAPSKRHDMLSSIYNASTMGGHLLASFGVYLIGKYNFVDPGWRLLYLCGSITALFGCLMRRSSPSTSKPVKFSLNETIWTHRRALILIAICAGFGSASYSMALVMINGLIPLISPINTAEIMEINTYLLIFDFCALPFFGWVATRFSREKLMITASLAVALLSVPLFISLEGASLAGIIAVRVILVIFGVAFFAPFHAWASQLVPPGSRNVVISLGYSLGHQALGSPTAALSLWCFQQTGMLSSVAWYWMFLGLLSSGALILALRSKRVLLSN